MIQTEKINFQYPKGPAFNFPAFRAETGQAALVLGPSGSGKSTWLQLASGLRRHQSAKIQLGNTDITKLSQRELQKFRVLHLGMIFQEPHFIPSLSAYENLTLATAFLPGIKNDHFLNDLIERLGIQSILKQKVHHLSLGEKQRLGIARALVHRPAFVFADEPTSNLDDANTHKVIELLMQEAKEVNASLVVVTHDQRLKDRIPVGMELSSIKERRESWK